MLRYGVILLELTGRFSTYTLSFIVLGTFWIGHHSLFHFVRKVNRGLLWLNLLFLLFITCRRSQQIYSQATPIFRFRSSFMESTCC
jgi:hypothetical protein